MAAAAAAPETWGVAAAAASLRRRHHHQRQRAAPICAALSTGVSRNGHYPSSSNSNPHHSGGGGSLDGGGAGAAAAPSAPQAPRAAQQQPQRRAEKVGVLLLNLGGPERLEDVQPFLYNLFADPDIIRLPAGVRFLQPLLASAIAALRAPKSAEGYAAIGGGSPLRRITDEQAGALRGALRRKGLEGAEVRARAV